MKKKCTVCYKIFEINNFTKQWNKKYKKYYPAAKCKECSRIYQIKHRKTDTHKKTRSKWQQKGYYGWNLGFENNIIRTDNRLVNQEFRNLWEKKADNLSETFNKDRNLIIKKRDNHLKLFQSAFKNLKRNRPLMKLKTQYINFEIFFSSISSYQSLIFANYFKNEWDKRIDEVVKSNRRETRI